MFLVLFVAFMWYRVRPVGMDETLRMYEEEAVMTLGNRVMYWEDLQGEMRVFDQDALEEALWESERIAYDDEKGGFYVTD